MSSTRADFDLLLAAPDAIEAELARGLLTRAGIPSLLHGHDRSLADFGCAGHRFVSRPDLLVPKGAAERAQAVLREAWDKDALSDDLAMGETAEKPPRRAVPGGLSRVLFVGLLVVAILVSYFRYFRELQP